MDAKVYLLKYNDIDITLIVLDSTFTDDTTGYYHFETQESDVYIKAAPDSATYPNEMPTYYDSSLTWNNATKITLQDCDSVEANFSTIAGNNPGGPGFISGKLSEGAGKHLWSGEAIGGVTLFLINDQGEPVTYATTNSQGWFEMDNLALGDYNLIADIPMLNNDVPPTITLSSEEAQKDSLIVKVVDNRLEISDPTGFDFPGKANVEVSIYPNPASTQVTIEITQTPSAEALIKVTNLDGKVLQSVFSNSEKIHLDIDNLSNGIYLLKINTDVGQVMRKLVITK
jgi:hypothetical protein